MTNLALTFCGLYELPFCILYGLFRFQNIVFCLLTVPIKLILHYFVLEIWVSLNNFQIPFFCQYGLVIIPGRCMISDENFLIFKIRWLPNVGVFCDEVNIIAYIFGHNSQNPCQSFSVTTLDLPDIWRCLTF